MSHSVKLCALRRTISGKACGTNQIHSTTTLWILIPKTAEISLILLSKTADEMVKPVLSGGQGDKMHQQTVDRLQIRERQQRPAGRETQGLKHNHGGTVLDTG